jgi:ParB family chromosome partitioning protein
MMILTSRIIVVEGRLPLNEAVVSSLMESMAAVGLLNSIIIRRDVGRQPVLVAGRHRLEAAIRLGWEAILCQEMSSEGLDAQIVEIDENLVRQVLSPAAVADLIGRRKALYEARHPEAAAGGNQHTKAAVAKLATAPAARFTSATSKATGKSERAIRLAATRSDRLGSDTLAKITGTSLDKGAELDALSKMPPAERAPLIERAAAGEPVTARPARSPRVDRLLATLRAEWDALAADERVVVVSAVRQMFGDEARGSQFTASREDAHA